MYSNNQQQYGQPQLNQQFNTQPPYGQPSQTPQPYGQQQFTQQMQPQYGNQATSQAQNSSTTTTTTMTTRQLQAADQQRQQYVQPTPQPRFDYTSIQQQAPPPQPAFDYTQIAQMTPTPQPAQQIQQASSSQTTTTTTTTEMGGQARQAAAAKGEAELKRFDQTVVEKLAAHCPLTCPLRYKFYFGRIGYLCGDGLHLILHEDVDAMMLRGVPPVHQEVNRPGDTVAVCPPPDGWHEPMHWPPQQRMQIGLIPIPCRWNHQYWHDGSYGEALDPRAFGLTHRDRPTWR